MRILCTIANHGTKNDGYLQRLLQEYRGMAHDIHIVVLTNVVKDLGSDVEVIISIPRGDPWSFPFAHKQLMADRVDDYDLFIYSEDDVLISERNIEAFLQAAQRLKEGEVAGFIRSEQSADGTYISTIHGHFHWDPNSVVCRGSDIFAYFTNEHSGTYILTQAQLRKVIGSGGFLVQPHQGKYHLPETAATDPYTQCGLRKMICISKIQDFILPHLPNKYVGKLGLPCGELSSQICALREIQEKKRPATVLLRTESNLGQSKFSKSYYEPLREDILSAVPANSRSVFSYGCGWGALEAELVQRGVRVFAAPLDSVIAACAEKRGIETVYGNSEQILAQLAGERFDCILVSNVLHLVPNPVRLLSQISELLQSGGVVIVTVPNLSYLGTRWRRIKRDPVYSSFGNFDRSGVHRSSWGTVRAWAKRAGLTIRETNAVIPESVRKRANFLSGVGKSLLAEEFTFIMERPFPLLVKAGKVHEIQESGAALDAK
jgi:SAM-dependent methyltransferase